MGQPVGGSGLINLIEVGWYTLVSLETFIQSV
jgi:hypothetical protein